MKKIKIGFLAARSVIMPKASLYIKETLIMALKEEGVEADVIVEDIGNGTISKTKDKLEKLLLVDFADVIVAVLNPQVAVTFKELLTDLDKVMILIEAGASQISFNDDEDMIFSNTQMYWQLSASMGNWLGKSAYKKVVAASSFYDSGNDQNAAFELGLLSADSSLQFQYVTHMDAGYDVQKLLNEVKKLQPEVVYLNYTGKLAVDVANAFIRNIDIPLATTPFVSQELLNSLDEANIIQTLPWRRDLPLAENEEFLEKCGASGMLHPEIFHVQGYETGKWIAFALSKGSLEDKHNFMNFEWDGPRGRISWNKNEKSFEGPVYISVISNNSLSEIKEITSASLLKETRKNLDQEVKSGWLNPYLFVT